MKKTGKIFISMMSLGIILNNVCYAASEATDANKGSSPTKYIFIGAAILVIGLLLFLGYKMDTKESGGSTKVSHKAEKTKKKLSAKVEEIKQNEGTYEADDGAYEEDKELLGNEDLNDSVEYNGDEEDSLFDAANDEEDDDEIEDLSDYEDEDSNGFDTSAVSKTSEPEPEPEPEAEEPEGEEFDTSIIDKLDEEEEPKNSFDETMLFNNSDFSATGSSLANEIDNINGTTSVESEKESVEDKADEIKDEVEDEPMSEIDTGTLEDKIDEIDFSEENLSEDNLSDDILPDEDFSKTILPEKPKEELLEPEEKSLNEETIEDIPEEVEPIDFSADDDSFINGLKDFKEPESTFGGFSTKDTEKEEKIEIEPEEDVKDIPVDNDFLSQMEANLQKNQEERKSKKSTTTKSTSKTKGTTKKK